MKDVKEKLLDFFSKYPEKKYMKGQTIIWADNDPEFVFYVTEGRVRQCHIFNEGQKVAVNVLRKGAFFPMSWAINRTPNKYFYEAVEATTLRCAPADDCIKLVKNDSDILFDLLSRVYRGTDGVLERMVYLMVNSAQKRVLFELLIEHKRSTAGKKLKSVINLSESELAIHTGLARETVNRQIRKLKQNGSVRVEKEGIIIMNAKKIEKQLYGE